MSDNPSENTNNSNNSQSNVLSKQSHSNPIIKSDDEWRKILSDSQFLYRQKATEPRGLTQQYGGFDDYFPKTGVFVCSNCEWPLFDAKTKFDCKCGWPGFYASLPNGVYEIADKDGVRREILCNQCSAHLGHWTDKENWNNPQPNERHCVASIAIKHVDNDTIVEAKYNGPLYCESFRPKDKVDDKFGTVYSDLRGGEAPSEALIAPEEKNGHLVWLIATDLRIVAVLDVPSEFVPELQDLNESILEALGFCIKNEDSPATPTLTFFHNNEQLHKSTKIDAKYTYLDVRGGKPEDICLVCE